MPKLRCTWQGKHSVQTTCHCICASMAQATVSRASQYDVVGVGRFHRRTPPPPPPPPSRRILATTALEQHCHSLHPVHSCYQTRCRLGKAGLAVSCKTAANAAVEAARQVSSLPSAGKKRKAKPAATSPGQAQKKGKKRRVQGTTAEDTPPNEATPEQARTGSTRRSRPPRPPAKGATTPADQGHKLGSTPEASLHINQCHASLLQALHLGVKSGGCGQACALQLPKKYHSLRTL